MVVTACSSTKTLTESEFSRSTASGDSIVATLPDYSERLYALKGKGRAIVSEPGNSDRLTIEFETTSDLSLISLQNRIGIKGGQMLVDQDSILIYYKMDDKAEKISINDGRLTSLNELVSLNFLKLINFTVQPDDVDQVMESNNSYFLGLKNGAQVYLSKESGLIGEVKQARRSAAPYSRIIYESYGELDGFLLPRKITIFSSDGSSRVVFLVRSLQVNPTDLNLKIDIPDNVVIERI